MNPSRSQIAMLRSLQARKGRDETGLFLVEGTRLLDELSNTDFQVEMLLLSKERLGEPEVLRIAETFRGRGVTVFEAPAHQVERVSDTVHSQGIVAAVKWQDGAPSDLRLPERAVVLALDGVSDPGNAGTTIRTAAWFGSSAALLGEGCADALNPKTVRATMGGLFHLPVCRSVRLPEALDDLKSKGFRLTVATMGGDADWQHWGGDGRNILVLGSEAHGVSSEILQRADRCVTIPRKGFGDSLNVAVSAGILLSRIEL